MKKYLLLIAACIVATASLTAAEANFDYSKITPHPRLWIQKGQEEKIKSAIEKYEPFKMIHNQILDESDERLTEPMPEYVDRGKRVSTGGIEKAVTYLSYSYRMTGDRKYAERALEEMKMACALKDWNPEHFLNTASMATAIAIGYDWLYDYLSEEDKSLIRNALMSKAVKIRVGRKFGLSNWNSTCNMGLIAAALAIYDEEPELAKLTIEQRVENNHEITNLLWGPDGGYPEGYSYWVSGTGNQMLLVESLLSALGSDDGLSQGVGFLESAYFVQSMVAPTGDSYCWFDGNSKVECDLTLFWFAKELNDPSLLWLTKEMLDNGDVKFSKSTRLPLLLAIACDTDMKSVKAPKRHFWFNRGTSQVFAYREGWKSADDAYLGVKAGTINTTHSHMDLGSFIYEKDGVRWAMEVERYGYEGLEGVYKDFWNHESQSSGRWTDIFYTSNRAHSTLYVDGQSQLVKSVSPIVETYESRSKKGAKVDMSDTYRDVLRGAERTIWLDAKNDLHVEDVITGDDAPSKVQWVMLTPVDLGVPVISQEDQSISINKDGKTKVLSVDAPMECKMIKLTNDPSKLSDDPRAAVQDKNVGTCRVGFEAIVPANETVTLRVTLK